MVSRPAVDVAVVGAGAAGMMTALRAARNPGIQVAVLEAGTRHGCNTEFSSGSLAAGGTRFQAAAGVDDSPERHAKDILAVSGDHDGADLVHAVCTAAPRYVEWLADELGQPTEVGLDMQRSGQSVPRLHTDPGRSGGRLLVRTLRRAMAAAPNIAFADDSPVADLLASEGRVTGVRVDRAGAVEEIEAAEVVLASDGFGNNRELVRTYCPTAADAFYGGVSTSNGDAVRWGVELGAELHNMSAYLGSGMVVAGHGTRVNPNLPWLGALLVDGSGTRFCDETAQGYSKLGGILRGLPDGRAVLIWDEPAHKLAVNSELMRESTAAGAYRRYDTVAEIAEGLGLPTDALATTVGAFASRSDLVERPGERLVPPYYAARITHGMLTTQGGVKVDTDGRVLRTDGGTVPGLSAAGGAAAGISGSSPDGYSSGNGLLAALGLGWIVGNRLAGVKQ